MIDSPMSDDRAPSGEAPMSRHTSVLAAVAVSVLVAAAGCDGEKKPPLTPDNPDNPTMDVGDGGVDPSEDPNVAPKLAPPAEPVVPSPLPAPASAPAPVPRSGS
jgi:hypothetical protein